jgi:hypothetical protein
MLAEFNQLGLTTMTTDFSFLKQAQVSTAETKDYVFNQFSIRGKHPVLKVIPATEANKEYFNAALQSAAKNKNRSSSLAEKLKQRRDEDRTLYPKYVVKGWEDVVNAQGEEVPFTQEDCAAFLAQLPDWIFDQFRDWCATNESFVESLDLEVAVKQ